MKKIVIALITIVLIFLVVLLLPNILYFIFSFTRYVSTPRPSEDITNQNIGKFQLEKIGKIDAEQIPLPQEKCFEVILDKNNPKNNEFAVVKDPSKDDGTYYFTTVSNKVADQIDHKILFDFKNYTPNLPVVYKNGEYILLDYYPKKIDNVPIKTLGYETYLILYNLKNQQKNSIVVKAKNIYTSVNSMDSNVGEKKCQFILNKDRLFIAQYSSSASDTEDVNLSYYDPSKDELVEALKHVDNRCYLTKFGVDDNYLYIWESYRGPEPKTFWPDCYSYRRKF